MNIIYLTQLQNNPFKYPNDNELKFELKGISETEISNLEQLYNNGIVFPKVLKELLYLAGDYCYVFDYNICENQQSIQEWVRENMEEMNRHISRPFYAFDIYGGDQFLFIYLDEGDDPFIYEAFPYENGSTWYRKTSNTIKSLAEKRINRIKKGENPY